MVLRSEWLFGITLYSITRFKTDVGSHLVLFAKGIVFSSRTFGSFFFSLDINTRISSESSARPGMDVDHGMFFSIGTSRQKTVGHVQEAI